MKITYTYVTGETTQVEVDEVVGSYIVESRRKESNLNRKERYHCVAIEGADFEGKDYTDGRTPETELLQKLDKQRIAKALAGLSDTQRNRLLLYAEGHSINEIARQEGVQPMAVWKSINAAKKKFLKNF